MIRTEHEHKSKKSLLLPILARAEYLTKVAGDNRDLFELLYSPCNGVCLNTLRRIPRFKNKKLYKMRIRAKYMIDPDRYVGSPDKAKKAVETFLKLVMLKGWKLRKVKLSKKAERFMIAEKAEEIACES